MIRLHRNGKILGLSGMTLAVLMFFQNCTSTVLVQQIAMNKATSGSFNVTLHARAFDCVLSPGLEAPVGCLAADFPGEFVAYLCDELGNRYTCQSAGFFSTGQNGRVNLLLPHGDYFLEEVSSLSFRISEGSWLTVAKAISHEIRLGY